MYKKHKRRRRNKPSQECLDMILTLAPLFPFNVFAAIDIMNKLKTWKTLEWNCLKVPIEYLIS
jgi:hypothetical protein